ncbi:aldehyde dehydrogenase family protein, partial [Rhizobium ruizarguesonis]
MIKEFATLRIEFLKPSFTRGVACLAVDPIENAITAARSAFPAWAELTPVKRGQILMDIVALMKRRSDELAEC